MKGTIHHINASRGMVAVMTKNEDYSVFELLSGNDVSVGDVVVWTGDTPLGREFLLNQTSGGRFEVYFQNHHVHKAQLRQQLLYA